MKKIIFKLSALSLITLISCQKTKTTPNNAEAVQQPKATTEEQNKLLNNLQSTSDNYISSIEATSNLKFNWGIVKADIEGAAVGAGAGALIGGPGGAAIGGVIGAAGYSIAKSQERTISPNLPKSDPNLGVIINPNNQYEYVGIYHNLIVNNVMGDNTLISENGSFSLNKTYNYVVQSTYNLSKVDASTIYSYNAFLNDYNTIYLPNVNKDFTIATESMVTFNRLTVVEKQILDIYWHAVSQLKSLETFENFTVLFENVLISSNFDSTSKSKLLSTLSVARYSQAYWNKL